MDIGSLFLILALLILVLLFIARPLFEQKAKAARNGDQQQAQSTLSALLAERDRTLTAIQDLDFDHSLGKVSEEDYPEQRSELLQRGAEILRQLDEIQPQPSFPTAAENTADALEAAIASRRTVRAGVAPRPNGHGAAPDDQIEIMIANRRRARSESSAGFCHKCGSPLLKSDRFCHKCGALVVER